MSRRWIVVLLPMLLAVGCKSLSESEPKREADRRWARARSWIALREAGALLARNDMEGARRELERAIAVGADDERLHVVLARIAIELEEYAEAERRIAQAGSAAAFLRGLLAETRGRLEAAERSYARAAKQSPRDAAPVLARARVLVAAGRDKEAGKLLRRARPRNVAVLVALGEHEIASGAPRKALAAFEKALAREPELERARRGRGHALHLLGRHREAVGVLRGIEGAERTLAQSALVAEDYETAVGAFRAHLERHGDDVDALYDLARALFLSGRNEETVHTLGLALARRPAFPEAVLLLGHVRYREERWKQALDCYREAERLGADLAPLEAMVAEAERRAQ